MRYGFVIDQDRCIGCHACTVACKEEHQVPVGVFRTWVKCIEKGAFPHTSRHFGVMRCNHCDSAPCIEICPTHSLHRLPNGIIDFDPRVCIGCKSCMQACPYDALYIDPNSNTAAKCNFCAHRVEAGLEPACVIVCPTHAILAGDLDQPGSEVSRAVATEKVSVRKPHKGTQPKLYYLGIEGDLLSPTRLSRQPSYMSSDRPPERPGDGLEYSSFDSSATREVYDVAHPAPWGWKIALYLWTKSIAAGVLLVAALLMNLDSDSGGVLLNVFCPALALFALGATLALLVFDLKRPARFFYLLTKPNFRSWLVLGAYVLMVYGGLSGAWLLEGMLHDGVPRLLTWLTAAAGAASAGYSAFLFAQAKGRDLWQSPLFLWHLLAHAFTAGAATVLVVSVVTQAGPGELAITLNILLASLTISLLMVLAEAALPHVSEEVAMALGTLTRGRQRGRFWGLAIGAGLIVPILLIAFMLSSGLQALGVLVAAMLALAGVWWYEDLWVKAGQAVPLS